MTNQTIEEINNHPHYTADFKYFMLRRSGATGGRENDLLHLSPDEAKARSASVREILGIEENEPIVHNERGGYQYGCAVIVWDAAKRFYRNGAAISSDDGLTLATLCDIVLGEEAVERSNDALVSAVGKLKAELKNLRERDEVANK